MPVSRVLRRSLTTALPYRWLKMDITTPDVVANCEDLKVLGKGDFKALIKWRTSLREEVCASVSFQHLTCQPHVGVSSASK